MAADLWLKLKLGYLENPKVAPVVAAHPRAVLLHLAMIDYCAQHVTDGFVPKALLPHICPRAGLNRPYRGQEMVNVLIDAGLLEVASGGWVVHDFLEHNPQLSRQSVAERRAAKRRIPTNGNIPEAVANANELHVPDEMR